MPWGFLNMINKSFYGCGKITINFRGYHQDPEELPVKEVNMDGSKKKLPRFLVIAVLLFGLLGALVIYIILVTDLPSRVYTAAQREYLSYNYGRSLSQAAPTWNEVLPTGDVTPIILTDWTSHVRATLDARYEEQQGVNATLYDLGFESVYHFTYPGPSITTTVTLFFPFPNNLETLHEVSFLVDGKEPANTQYSVGGISWLTELRAGKEHTLAISYRADGANSFGYSLERDRLTDVDIQFLVTGVTGSKVLRSSLPTSDTSQSSESETFTWYYPGLIPNRNILLELPTHLSFAQRVARLQNTFQMLAGLAPFLVAFFLISLAVLFKLGKVDLRLEGYLMVGLCLAFFFPALTFLSGLVELSIASALSFVAISGLIVGFLGLAIGWRETTLRTGWLLIIFLAIFSLGLFTPWRSLMVVLGGILLIATFMLAYALRLRIPEAEAEILPAEKEELVEAPEPEIVSPREDTQFQKTELHCPCCGRSLADDFKFCPTCGYDSQSILRCEHCNHRQFVQLDIKPSFCIRCGQEIKQ